MRPDGLPGVIFSVVGTDGPLTEYLSREDPGLNVRYIEATPRGAFSVSVAFERDFGFLGDFVAWTIGVDGGQFVARGVVARPDDVHLTQGSADDEEDPSPPHRFRFAGHAGEYVSKADRSIAGY